MTETKESVIDGLIGRQLRQERNRDVYEERLTAPGQQEGRADPSCIYFYYVRIDNSGMVRVDHYFYDRGEAIPYEEMKDREGIVKTLALNARPRTRHKNPPREGGSFKDVVWNKRSYIVMFFDERNWTFHQRVGGKPSVAFNVSEGQTPNQSFFDAHDMMIRMPKYRSEETDERSAIFFVNHYKDSNGGDLGPGVTAEESYKIDMYLQAKYTESGAPAMTVIFDPTGTNKSP